MNAAGFEERPRRGAASAAAAAVPSETTTVVASAAAVASAAGGRRLPRLRRRRRLFRGPLPPQAAGERGTSSASGRGAAALLLLLCPLARRPHRFWASCGACRRRRHRLQLQRLLRARCKSRCLDLERCGAPLPARVFFLLFVGWRSRKNKVREPSREIIAIFQRKPLSLSFQTLHFFRSRASSASSRALCAWESRRETCESKESKEPREKDWQSSLLLSQAQAPPLKKKNKDRKAHLLLAVAFASGTCPATRARRHLAKEKKKKEEERREGERERESRESRKRESGNLSFPCFFFEKNEKNATEKLDQKKKKLEEEQNENQLSLSSLSLSTLSLAQLARACAGALSLSLNPKLKKT